MRALGSTINRIPARAGEDGAALALLLAAALPAIQRCAGPISPGEGLSRLAPAFISTFLLFGILPALAVRFVLREPLADYGLRIGDARFGAAAVGTLLPLAAVLVCLPASLLPEVRSVYPLDRAAMDSAGAFIRLEAARGVCFYTAWEFFFRGFILFSLRTRIGDRRAVLAQTIPSCLWHIGLPSGELLAAIPAGIVFGALALRTRSVIWPFLLHLGIGVFLDLWILVR